MIKPKLRCTIVLLMYIWLASSCQKQLWPSDQGFPDQEIVFSYLPPNDHVFGFIHPDGTELITRTMVESGATAEYPTWSPDGEFIAFRTEQDSGTYFSPLLPRIVTSTGKVLGQCRDWKWSRAHGRFWVTEEAQILLLWGPSVERDRIVLANCRSCKVISTLFEASNNVDLEILDSAHMSSQGWLAVSRIIKHSLPAETRVLVTAPDSDSPQVIGEGIAPAWNKTGEWLAFTAFDGIYIVHQDGSQKRKLVDIDSQSKQDPNVYGGLGWVDSPPAPSWSPDGKWIVYHLIS